MGLFDSLTGAVTRSQVISTSGNASLPTVTGSNGHQPHQRTSGNGGAASVRGHVFSIARTNNSLPSESNGKTLPGPAAFRGHAFAPSGGCQPSRSSHQNSSGHQSAAAAPGGQVYLASIDNNVDSLSGATQKGKVFLAPGSGKQSHPTSRAGSQLVWDPGLPAGHHNKSTPGPHNSQPLVLPVPGFPQKAGDINRIIVNHTFGSLPGESGWQPASWGPRSEPNHRTVKHRNPLQNFPLPSLSIGNSLTVRVSPTNSSGSNLSTAAFADHSGERSRNNSFNSVSTPSPHHSPSSSSSQSSSHTRENVNSPFSDIKSFLHEYHSNGHNLGDSYFDEARSIQYFPAREGTRRGDKVSIYPNNSTHAEASNSLLIFHGDNGGHQGRAPSHFAASQAQSAGGNKVYLQPVLARVQGQRSQFPAVPLEKTEYGRWLRVSPIKSQDSGYSDTEEAVANNSSISIPGAVSQACLAAGSSKHSPGAHNSSKSPTLKQDHGLSHEESQADRGEQSKGEDRDEFVSRVYVPSALEANARRRHIVKHDVEHQQHQHVGQRSVSDQSVHVLNNLSNGVVRASRAPTWPLSLGDLSDSIYPRCVVTDLGPGNDSPSGGDEEHDHQSSSSTYSLGSPKSSSSLSTCSSSPSTISHKRKSSRNCRKCRRSGKSHKSERGIASEEDRDIVETKQSSPDPAAQETEDDVEVNRCPVVRWMSELPSLYEPECNNMLQSKSIQPELSLSSHIMESLRKVQNQALFITNSFAALCKRLGDRRRTGLISLIKDLEQGVQSLISRFNKWKYGRDLDIVLAGLPGLKFEPTWEKEEEDRLLSLQQRIRLLLHQIKMMVIRMGGGDTGAILAEANGGPSGHPQRQMRVRTLPTAQLAESVANLREFGSLFSQLVEHLLSQIIRESVTCLNKASKHGGPDLHDCLLLVCRLGLEGNHICRLFAQQGGVGALLKLIPGLHSQPETREVVLRALSTVCCVAEGIKEFEKADGLKLLAEVLRKMDADAAEEKGTELERREAAGVLAQVTSPWIENCLNIERLEQHAYDLVSSLTSLCRTTKSCETFLLSSAALANLTYLSPLVLTAMCQLESLPPLLNYLASRVRPSIYILDQVATVLANLAASQHTLDTLLQSQDAVVSTLLLLLAADHEANLSAVGDQKKGVKEGDNLNQFVMDKQNASGWMPQQPAFHVKLKQQPKGRSFDQAKRPSQDPKTVRTGLLRFPKAISMSADAKAAPRMQNPRANGAPELLPVLAATQRVQQKAAIAIGRLCLCESVCRSILSGGGLERLTELAVCKEARIDSDYTLVAVITAVRRMATVMDISEELERLGAEELLTSNILESLQHYGPMQESFV